MGLRLGEALRRDEAQVDASLGRKDGMGLFEVSAMFAHEASGHRLALGDAGSNARGRLKPACLRVRSPGYGYY